MTMQKPNMNHYNAKNNIPVHYDNAKNSINHDNLKNINHDFAKTTYIHHDNAKNNTNNVHAKTQHKP
jgi:hypothetical protein